MLLVAAIEIAGLAVAFPVGIGLALVIGVLLNYFLAPQGNPLLLFGGLIFVVLAIVVDAMAYQRRELVRKAVGKKGVQISLVAGVLMGLFYPFVAKAGSGPASLSPYSVTFCFALGVLVCAIPSNMYLMRNRSPGNAPYQWRTIWPRVRCFTCGESSADLSGAPARCLASSHRMRTSWARLFPMRWARRNLDLGHLGSLCVEGIQRRSCGGPKIASVDVSILYCGLTAIAVAPLFSR